MSDLIDRSLLRWDPGPARYRLHDLLRPIAAAPWDWRRGPLGPDGPAPERLDEALARHAAHFLGVLRAAQQRYLEGHDGVTAGLAAYDADAAQITAGQAWAAAGAAEAAARLAQDYPHAGVYVLYLRLHPRERVRWLETGLAAARRLGERGAEGAHLGNLGVAWAALGEPRKAIGYYEQQLVIVREIGDRRGEAAGSFNLGNLLWTQGEPQAARRQVEHALALFKSMESPHAETARRWLAGHP